MESEKSEKKYDEVDIDSAIDDFGDETVQFSNLLLVAKFVEKSSFSLVFKEALLR